MTPPYYEIPKPRDPATYRNTKRHDPNGWPCTYTLCQTDIVVVDSNTITLANGGYRTNTTKKRINEIFTYHGLPYYLYQKNFVWYIGVVGVNNKVAIPFRNGMVLARTIKIRKVVAQ